MLNIRILFLLWVMILSVQLNACAASSVASNSFNSDLVIENTGQIFSRTGCILEYRLYAALDPLPQALVVLAHGFMRNQKHMAGLAQTLAVSGINTVTLDFCNMHSWEDGHLQNAVDMIQIARHMHAQRIVYAGFSAGALAALIAGHADPRSVGILALDLVDKNELGVRAARLLHKPLIGFIGAPSVCNAQNNGAAVYTVQPKSQVLYFPKARHCDFETPTDMLCLLACTSTGTDDQEQREAIIHTSVKYLHKLFNQNKE